MILERFERSEAFEPFEKLRRLLERLEPFGLVAVPRLILCSNTFDLSRRSKHNPESDPRIAIDIEISLQ